MKLTSVVIGPAGFSELALPSDIVVMSFKDPEALNPYNVVSIDGLDAGAIRPRYYTSASGEKFYTLEQEPKDIIFKIGLNPDYHLNQTHSQLRDKVYKVISGSKSGSVDIHFKNANVVVATLNGFATKIETDPVSKDPMILVTINCEDPTLRSPDPFLVNYDLFSFSNFVIQDDLSTAPHGISFRLKINAAISDLIIADPTDASWSFRVIPIGGFSAGEVLYFSNELGKKELRTRSRNLLSRVTKKTIWPVIFPGENRFSFNHTGSLSLQHLSYYRAYWGV